MNDTRSATSITASPTGSQRRWVRSTKSAAADLRAWAATLVFAWAAVGAAAEPTAPESSPSPSPPAVTLAAPPAPRNRAPVYQLHTVIDTAVLLGGAALWITPVLVVGNTAAGPACDPCDAAKLNALDRTAIGLGNPHARQAANAWLALPGIYAIADIADVGGRHWRSYLSDFVVIAETLAWDGALQEIVRRAVRRPRPYLYTPGLYLDERSSPDATFSFYSGHTSASFAVAASFSYTYMVRHPRSRWTWAVFATTMTLASAEPVLRVLSGDHFPTDVLVGAVMGTAIGLLIPALHRLRMPAAMALVPTSGEGHAALSLVGRF